MLVLSRKVSETILIGEDIAITVTRIDAGVVRLSITAPKEILILRSELQDTFSKRSIESETRSTP